MMDDTFVVKTFLQSNSSPFPSQDVFAEPDFNTFTDSLFNLLPPVSFSEPIEPVLPPEISYASTLPSATTFSLMPPNSAFQSGASIVSHPDPTKGKRNDLSKRSDINGMQNRCNVDHHVKRQQTKLACTWCRKSGKKCEAQRPCFQCIKYNRSSQCVDAPPRRQCGINSDRGTYKKTRDLAAVDYQAAVKKRRVYIARARKKGRVIQIGLTPDEILLEKARKDEELMGTGLIPPFSYDGTPKNMVQGEFPFAGPLDGLFTYPAFPEIEELLSSSPSCTSDSLFDVSSPTTNSSPGTDYDVSELSSFPEQMLQQFPYVMHVVAVAKAAEAAQNVGMEVW
jgi:hypothetical protein